MHIRSAMHTGYEAHCLGSAEWLRGRESEPGLAMPLIVPLEKPTGCRVRAAVQWDAQSVCLAGHEAHCLGLAEGVEERESQLWLAMPLRAGANSLRSRPTHGKSCRGLCQQEMYAAAP